MRKALVLGALGAVVIGATAAWQVQRESMQGQAELLARATISEEQARQTALASVPGGTITDAEIEEEDGRLIYSFDIEVAGRKGSFDVEIDARTGELLQSEAEDDDEEEDDDDDDDDRAERAGR